jgi:hypothetical protein
MNFPNLGANTGVKSMSANSHADLFSYRTGAPPLIKFNDNLLHFKGWSNNNVKNAPAFFIIGQAECLHAVWGGRPPLQSV